MDPLPPESRDAIEELGAPVESVRITKADRQGAFRLFFIGTCVLAVCVATLGFGLWAKLTGRLRELSFPDAFWGVTLLVTIAAVVFIELHLKRLLRAKPVALWRCPNGLIVQRTGTLAWYRWEELRRFSGWGKDVQWKATVYVIEFPLYTEQAFRFRLELPGGERFVFDEESLPGRRSFFFCAMTSAVSAVPAFARRIESGEEVYFGAFTLSQAGVGYRGRVADWSAVRYVTVTASRVRVHLSGGWVLEEYVGRVSMFLPFVRLIDAATDFLNPPSVDAAHATGEDPLDFFED